ncbi:unnamed protein product [Rotaria sp. Silwood2]|nr:unnamed protein product [Rotaria sp. Silwood2]CAF3139395.1 unnamed protein product [Rotaria sp. Silwood2]CAF4519207.1 unnamed protein product [Rotaria sp. Silwood2]
MACIPPDVRNYFKLDLLLGRSCSILRQVFKNRYSLFTGGQTWDDSSQCGSNYLVNIIGKSKKFNLTAVQRTLIHDGDSNQFDITTLTTLLLNTERPKKLNKTQIQQLNNEDQLLIELRETRNILAHHPSKSIDNNEFHQLWSKLVVILVAFGEVQEVLDTLKSESIFEQPMQSINEANVREILRLNSLGTQAHKEEKFFDAIALFTKAVDIKDVSNHYRAIVYSNMSASRLALYDQRVNLSHVYNGNPTDQRYHALRDAKQARMLSSTSWQGHYRVGKAYSALNEHEKAINSYERALALDPNNIKIQEALTDSRQIQCQQARHDHLDPRGQPVTMHEHLNEMKQKYGIDSHQIRSAHNLLKQVDPTAADVVAGHKYEHGDIDIKQDYEQAAKYFAKAANQGNAEGLYNLARLTDRGLGVRKDPQLATKLLEQAAAQSPEHSKFKGIPNIGVAEAEHSLGLRYMEGVLVPKNFSIAAQWYQRAADHGSAEAANNLAIMYLNGTGIEKNLEKAKQLFELSARRGDPKAMMNLADVLLEINELEMARTWFDRACEAGNLYAQAQRNEFESRLRQKQQTNENSSQNFSQTMKEVNSFSDFIKAIKLMDSLSHKSSIYDLNILNEHAKRGSWTAEKLSNALRHFYVALNILMQSESLSNEQETLFIHEFAQCCRIEHTVAEIPSIEIEKRIIRIIDRVFERCGYDSNIVNSQLDEDVRMCYVVLHMDEPELNLRFLDSCKQNYPKSLLFHEFHAAMNVLLGRFGDALNDAHVGLKIDPNYYELLFIKATLFVCLGKKMNEVIEAYQEFLAVAPKDHCRVPESYYSMAGCYLACTEDDNTKRLIKKLYQQGEEAEKIQLPCFLPYKSDKKMALQHAFDDEQLSDAIPVLVSDCRSRLTDPHRIDIFKRHRQWSGLMSKNKNSPVNHTMTQKPRVKQSTAKSLVGLKSISLREINPTKDHVYNQYILFVTIIDEALTWKPSIHLIIQDENHDCEHMVVYGFNEQQGEHLINNVFTIGTRMHIINPYLRIGSYDLKPFIRVDDFSSIVFQNESERMVNMCRCCGQPNALHVCSRCKRARYCSKECQTIDWKSYDHKLICQK